MNDTRQKLKNIKQAIIDSSRDSLDFDNTKSTILLWLSQFNFPKYPDKNNWEECLESFPDASPESKKPTEGLKLRFLLRMYTTNHKYVISVIECFNLDAIGVGILSIHVNLDQIEYNKQKTLELTYKASFDSSLKPKQTLYVESFDSDTLKDSLNNGGLAILNNELMGSLVKEILPTIKATRQMVTFPEIK